MWSSGASRALLLLLVFASACAPRPRHRPVVNPDRPSYSDGAGLVVPGVSLLTVGYSDSRTPDTRVQSVGEGLLRVGLHSRVELRVQPNSWLRQRTGVTRTTGWQDLRVGVKMALRAPTQTDWRPAASLVLMTSVPSGARTIGGHAPLQPEARLVITSQPHARFGITMNAWYLHTVADDRREGVRSATWLGAYSLTDRVGLYAELFATGTRGDHRRYHDAGLTLRLTNDVQLDAWLGHRAGVRERAAGVGLAIQR